MIIPIIQRFKEISYEAYLKSLEEAKIAEDEDLVEVEDIAEECPICDDEEELRQYIRNCVITREIKYLVVHCTATQPDATVSAILKYWKENKKWINVGYHILLPKTGFTLLSEFDGITNGASGYNGAGVHISYIGGIDKNGKALDTRTSSQARLIEVFIEEFKKKIPNIKVFGHNEIPKANKACPSFKMQKEYPNHWTGK